MPGGSRGGGGGMARSNRPPERRVSKSVIIDHSKNQREKQQEKQDEGEVISIDPDIMAAVEEHFASKLPPVSDFKTATDVDAKLDACITEIKLLKVKQEQQIESALEAVKSYEEQVESLEQIAADICSEKKTLRELMGLEVNILNKRSEVIYPDSK